ncbi:hypothetical protein F2P56_025021 [Juglans regia]|uniref:Protein NIM1-INTERACTING 1-like n=1 Tax=Juglans regia TaxID=51240 RepID=A0A833UCL6_JUGRE|nr:hypothetical protein F2P56_025021 [Juglans regia]
MEAAAAASRKRKNCHYHDDDDLEDDEQKMEKFYDLIRNIREARDRFMNGSDATKGIQNKKKNKKAGEDHHHQEQTNIQVWTPSFEREDFMEESRREAQFKTVHAGSSEREAGARKDNDKEEEEERLDLKLSL